MNNTCNTEQIFAPPPPLQEQERVRWEEQRKAMQQDAYQKQEVAKYQDQLARQRAEAEHDKQRARNVELVRLQVSRRTSVAAAWFRALGSGQDLFC